MVRARMVVIGEPGGAEVLRLEERELRDPGPGEALVEVAAAGLNRADLLQRRGLYPAPPGVAPDVPGLEFSGRVVARGPDAHVGIGDRVMGLVAGGAMASHVIVPAAHLLPVPERLDEVSAAAIPEAYVTAWDAVFAQAGARAGDTLLVHAAASGVGTAAVQLGHALGLTTLGTSRSADKLARLAPMGLDHALLVARPGRAPPADGTPAPRAEAEAPRFAERAMALTDGRGVDVILDLVGAAYLSESLAALAPRGRMVVVGLLGGARAELDLGRLLTRRLHVIGTVLRGRSDAEKTDLLRHFARDVLPLLADGRCAPVVDAVLPFERVAEAHERLEAGATVGKLVLAWDAGARP